MTIRLIAALVCCCATAASLGAFAAVSGAEQGQLEGGYRGRTAQGRRIRLRLQDGKLELRHFSVRLRCRDGSILIDEESGFQPTRLRHGAFGDDQVGSTDEVWFRGRARHSRVRGRLRVKDRWGRVRCDSHWVRFTATRRR